MKHSCLLLLLLNLMIINTASAQKMGAEYEAIRKVLNDETRYYFERNFDKWADTYLHDSSIYAMYTGPSGHSQMIGWEHIAEAMKPTFQNAPPVTGDALAPYSNKFDFHYLINSSC